MSDYDDTTSDGDNTEAIAAFCHLEQYIYRLQHTLREIQNISQSDNRPEMQQIAALIDVALIYPPLTSAD